MDYRMYSGGASANENVVSLIKESAYNDDGLKFHTPLKFVGFTGDVGTVFYLNGSNSPMKIPSTGYFITPFDGERYMGIYSLVFENDFTGDIYYII